MASIRGYLYELEARLAPSLDAQSLQERLTEAENHLLDRAQEFEEIGLPAVEAEARAVAAFGDPEEFAVNLAPRVTPGASTSKKMAEPPKRDIALQLAWSAVGLGIVSMLSISYGAAVGGGAATFFIFLGALFGRTTALWRLAVLSGAGALSLFPVLLSSYVPVPVDSTKGEAMGLRLKDGPSGQTYAHRIAVQQYRTFNEYLRMVDKGGMPEDEDGKFLGPSRSLRDMEPYGYRGWQSLDHYEDVAKAKSMWLQYGDALRQKLEEDIILTTPSVLTLTAFERANRLAATSAVAGGMLMSLMTGSQALGLALRSFFVWLGSLRRKLVAGTMAGRWESPRR